MKSALVFLALVALSQAGVLMPRTLESRIVNGEDAKLGEIPYQVSIQTRSGFHFCGGSILNAHYVITAAHCVRGLWARSIRVAAGGLNYDDAESVHYVGSIIMHEKYSIFDSAKNDIALLRVDLEFEKSPAVDFAVLPEAHLDVPANSVAVVSGWGDLWEGGDSPRELQRADLVIADQSYCSEMYKSIGLTVHDSQICAYDPVNVTGACHGDSGGPLTVDGKLVGVVSWGNGCGSSTYPTVYTRVSEYIDWIKAHTF